MELLISISDTSRFGGSSFIMSSRIACNEMVDEGHLQTERLSRLLDLNSRIEGLVKEYHGISNLIISRPPSFKQNSLPEKEGGET